VILVCEGIVDCVKGREVGMYEMRLEWKLEGKKVGLRAVGFVRYLCMGGFFFGSILSFLDIHRNTHFEIIKLGKRTSKQVCLSHEVRSREVT